MINSSMCREESRPSFWGPATGVHIPMVVYGHVQIFPVGSE